MKINNVIQEDVKVIVNSIAKEVIALEGQTILITGGSGFLGKYFLNTFWYLNKNVFSKKCKVISIDNFITGTGGDDYLLKDENFKFIKHDVKEALSIIEPVDYVIHAAGIASPVYYMKYPLETIEVATTGTKNLLEFSKNKKVKSFLFFSSSEIYGDPDPKHVPTKETYNGNVSCVGPRACYDESKRLGETLCSTYWNLYKLPVKVVRPFNIYGPGMRRDDYRVVPSFLTSAFTGRPLPIHENGEYTRSFCYISDAVTGFLKTLLSGENGEAFNIGDSRVEITMMDLAKMITKIVGGTVRIKKVPYPENYPNGGPLRRCPNLSKSKSLLGYQPLVCMETGLRKTMEWYKEAGDLDR